MWTLKSIGAAKHAAGFALSAIALVGVGHGTAAAQQSELPDTIRIIVPFSPGGANDIYARVVADRLAARTKRTVIVENKPGAGGWIGARGVHDAPKDGSVLMSWSVSLLTSAATMANPPFDAYKSFVPVSILSEAPLLVAASTQSGIKTPQQLLDAAKDKNGQLTYATGGAGTLVHLATELVSHQSGVKFTHVPYKGGSAANADVVGGHVDFTMAAPGTLKTLIEGKRVNAVAVTTLEPTSKFPDLPTMSSVVPGFEVTVWTALWAPKGTPDAVLNALNKEINAIANSKDFEKLLADDGAVALDLTPAEAQEKAARSYKMWSELAKAQNISVGS